MLELVDSWINQEYMGNTWFPLGFSMQMDQAPQRLWRVPGVNGTEAAEGSWCEWSRLVFRDILGIWMGEGTCSVLPSDGEACGF